MIKKYHKLYRTVFMTTVTMVMLVSLTITSFADIERSYPDAEKLSLNSKSAMVYCATTGETIYAENKNLRLEPASMTKLMTALLAVENLDLDDTVTIDKETASITDSTLHLKEGEEFIARDLLYATLVISSNDSAVALAKAVAGSVPEFAKMMNERAKKIGAKSTNFVTANGLPDANHYSTAYDTILIAEEALSNKLLREISTTREYTMAATNMRDAHTLKNINESLNYPGVFGGKTGLLDNYNCSVVMGFEKDGLEYYAVVMEDNIYDREADIAKLMDYGAKYSSKSKAFEAGDTLGSVKIKHGEVTEVTAVAKSEGYYYLPEGSKEDQITIKLVPRENLEAPIKKGQAIGKAKIYLNDKVVGKTTILAGSDVNKGWFTSYIGLSNKSATVIGIILVALLVILIIMAALRKKKRVAGLLMALIVATGAMSGVFFTTQTSFADTIEKPNIYATSALMYCANTGETIYAKNTKKKVDPLSTTKILTALIVTQKLELDDEVTVSKAAAAEYGDSLTEGEKLSVDDLLHYMLMVSSNDAAYALAEAVSGDAKTFAKLMNDTASSIGTTRSHFVNPNGMQASGHYTTAADMLKIEKAAFSNDMVLKVMQTKKYTVQASNKHKKVVLKNGSRKYTGVEGVYCAKTGYWDFYNCGIVAGYEKNGLKFYIVLLEDTESGRDLDFESLIPYGESRVKGNVIEKAGTLAGKAKVKHGAKTKVNAYLASEAIAYLPNEASSSLISTRINFSSDVKAPLKSGDKVGTFDIYLADELANSVDIIVKEDVATGWLPSYIGISNRVTIVICIILLIVLGLFITVLVLRAQNRKKRRLARERKIMELAMAQEKRDMDRTMRDWKF